ncbi:MAG: hypothetical protein Q8L29_04475 [archaeon]|nr:hypothetical protein [archaeon]
MEDEKHDQGLEDEFDKLSYEEIDIVLKELGTRFLFPLKQFQREKFIIH